MIRGLERTLGIEAVLDRQPEQPGDVPQTWADVEKASRLFGYVPKTPFEEGVARFAEWLLNEDREPGTGSGQVS
jgi:UDP-glucuronate 4-epimerase